MLVPFASNPHLDLDRRVDREGHASDTTANAKIVEVRSKLHLPGTTQSFLFAGALHLQYERRAVVFASSQFLDNMEYFYTLFLFKAVLRRPQLPWLGIQSKYFELTWSEYADMAYARERH